MREKGDKVLKIELIYYTPDYHKLVEATARICYKSEDKTSETGHRFLRGIMGAGHVSVSSVGNLVFKLMDFDINEVSVDLLNLQEITPFIRWSFEGGHCESKGDYISMNMLTLLDIIKKEVDYEFSTDLVSLIVEETNRIPYLRWFYDKETKFDDYSNKYLEKDQPKLYEPIVLDEDYTKLKFLGLTEYELGIHSTITMNFITDRSAGLQLWRHGASTGGCELSQRYVKRDDAKYRPMVGIENCIQEMLDVINKQNIDDYNAIYLLCKQYGMRDGRAKEVARSILANGIFTQCIQSRTYRNWMHLFKLRDNKHAQLEVQEDVISMKHELNKLGVPTK